MSTALSNPSAEAVSTADVAEYLRQHPGFFSQHLDLLELMTIPHPCGDAVSLVTRQLDLLRERSGRVQQQLDGLVRIARENEVLYQRLHQLTLTLLDAGTLDDVLAGLVSGMAHDFQADVVTVRILAPSVEGLASELMIRPDSYGVALCDQVLLSGKPLCGHPKEEQSSFLFGRLADEVASMVVLPLNHNGLCGLLAIGSRDADHFRPGMDFALLSRLSEVLAARMLAVLPSP